MTRGQEEIAEDTRHVIKSQLEKVVTEEKQSTNKGGGEDSFGAFIHRNHFERFFSYLL